MTLFAFTCLAGLLTIAALPAGPLPPLRAAVDANRSGRIVPVGDQLAPEMGMEAHAAAQAPAPSSALALLLKASRKNN